MRHLLWLGLLLVPLSAYAAEAYKCKGPKGETIFSDTPCGDGKTIELREVPTYESQPVPSLPPLPAKKKAADQGYQLSFSKPAPDAVLRDNLGRVEVELNLKPGLGPDDFVLLKLDGEPVGKQGRQTSWSLEGVERGMHTLTAEILNQDGKLLIAATTSFVLHQASANFGARLERELKPGQLPAMPGDPNYVERSLEPGHEWAEPSSKDKQPAPIRVGGPRK